MVVPKPAFQGQQQMDEFRQMVRANVVPEAMLRGREDAAFPVATQGGDTPTAQLVGRDEGTDAAASGVEEVEVLLLDDVHYEHRDFAVSAVGGTQV